MNASTKSHFLVDGEKYDATMTITIRGEDRDKLLASLYFELDGYEIFGLVPDTKENHLTRVLLFKKNGICRRTN
jgi:hypothetical protein